MRSRTSAWRARSIAAHSADETASTSQSGPIVRSIVVRLVVVRSIVVHETIVVAVGLADALPPAAAVLPAHLGALQPVWADAGPGLAGLAHGLGVVSAAAGDAQSRDRKDEESRASGRNRMHGSVSSSLVPGGTKRKHFRCA